MRAIKMENLYKEPHLGLNVYPKSANTAERDKKDKHVERTIAEDAYFVSLFNCEDST